MHSRLTRFIQVNWKIEAFALAIIVFGLAVSAALAQSVNTSAEISIAAGNSHTCTMVNGSVRCWGLSVAVGAPRTTDRPSPVPVTGLPEGITQISAGSHHTCALTPANGLMCWGYNESGQLGDGTHEYRQIPVPVLNLGGPVTSVGLGYGHTCAVLQNTGVQCWGQNANYQLGASGFGYSEQPVTVEGLTGVEKITGGSAHTCALLNSGALKCWGYNYYGSLGNGQSGSSADTPIPQDVLGLDQGVADVAAGYISTCALNTEGAVLCWGLLGELNSTVPITVTGLESGVTALAMGVDHLCTLHEGGEVRCLGQNSAGQLGDGTNESRMYPQVVLGLESGAVALEAGLYHTCAATENGQVFCWGSDGLGQLGIGTTSFATQPWPVLSLNGEAAGFASGGSYICAFTQAGALYCWGQSNSGNLGFASQDFTSYPLPQPVTGLSSGVTQVTAGAQTCAIVNGGAQCWGRNEKGQLGNGTFEPSSTPTQVSGLTNGVDQVAVPPGLQHAHTCAVVGGGAYCWGSNYWGELGNGQSGSSDGVPTPQAVLGLSQNVSDIAPGGQHTCAVYNGAALCWGSGYYGQLGNNESGAGVIHPSPVVVSNLGYGVTGIAAGGQFTCAVSDGAAWCWGSNAAGQLGDGSMADSAVPVQVSGLENGVTAISTGDNSACALKAGEVWCWGGGSGLGVPYQIKGLTGATHISANYASCVMDSEGMACWGSNDMGQMGDGRIFQSRTALPVLGFGPQPELRLNYDQAAPGSFLRLVGANFPPNATVLLKSNGQAICRLETNSDGFFPAVIRTAGGAEGYYEIRALVEGTSAATGLTLAPGAPARTMEGGGPACDLTGVGETPPVPTPEVPPGTSLPSPEITWIMPAQGDASQMAQIEIFGKNFQPGAVARLATIEAIQTNYNDSTHLTALFPGGIAVGTYPLVVINPDWSPGLLLNAYTAMNTDPGSPVVQDDLYGQNYELTSEQLYETEGQPTTVHFVVRRAGGSTVLNNVLVSFYAGPPGLTDPANQATWIGESNLVGLATNGHQWVTISWTPAGNGYLELYAIIDPLNAVAELNEGNNLYHNGVQVLPAEPVDYLSPQVTDVNAPLVVNVPVANLQVEATDYGGSGVVWVDTIVWEYFPACQGWFMTRESGWQVFNEGTVNNLWINLGDFSGARVIDVWVADAQNNISLEPYSILVNFIEPDNFIFMDESHLFMFPLYSGDSFIANLTNLSSQDDADLYLWPPDYPTHNYWASTNPAGQPEWIGTDAPVDGYYWLEVYGYDSAFYNLTTSFGRSQQGEDHLTSPRLEPPDPPTSAGNLPPENYHLSFINTRVFLPVLIR